MTPTAMLVAAALSAPAQAWELYIDPDLCYADDSLEAWVEGGAGELTTEWDFDDLFWDNGGSIDVVDQDGIFITCPPCPPAEDGDLYTLSVSVTDDDGTTTDSLLIEQACSDAPKDEEIACSTMPVRTPALLLALAGLLAPLRRRRPATTDPC